MTTDTDRGYVSLLGTILDAKGDDFWLRWGFAPPGKKLCVGCGKLIPERKNGSFTSVCCEECYQARHYVTLVCGQCGRAFNLTNKDYKARLRERKIPLFFCNRKCFGRYIGTRYGVKRKHDHAAIYKLWMETRWSGSDIARHLGIPIGTALCILQTYPEYVCYRLTGRKHD